MLQIRNFWLKKSITRFHINQIIRKSHYIPAENNNTENNGKNIKKKNDKVTLQQLRKKYLNNIPISALTVHDYPTARVADKAEVDISLIGDSLSMVALGYDSTNKLTIEEMLHHCRAVSRANSKSYVVADLVFGSYEIGPKQAMETTIKYIREGGSIDAVKLEGASENNLNSIKALINELGIPVMGHIGLTPQKASSLGGFKVQAKNSLGALKLLDDAIALQNAGCFSMVVEAVPAPIAEIITKIINIPTIGIGAGNKTSGQVLVQMDMLGYFEKFTPKFVKLFSNSLVDNSNAVKEYINEVEQRSFPSSEHSYSISEQNLDEFKTALIKRGYNVD